MPRPWIAIGVASILAGNAFFWCGAVGAVNIGFETYALSNDLVTPVAIYVLTLAWAVLTGTVIKKRITQGRPYFWNAVGLTVLGSVVGYSTILGIASMRASYLMS